MNIVSIHSVSVILALLLLEGKARGQTFDPQTYDSILDKSELRIGIRYTSNYYYMGRSDSAAAPYLSPTVGYYHKSGFYGRSSLSYLIASGEERVDLVTLTGGYDYFGKKIAAGISVTEYFFSDLSYTVQAEMRTYFNGYAGYDLSGFMFYVDTSLGFSEGTDVFLSGEINRTFYGSRNRLRITPAIYVNAGTQKYSNAYYTQRSINTGSGKGHGQGHGGQQVPATEHLEIAESDKFEILDYEADLQVSYIIHKVRFYVLATWTFPVNPATVLTNTGVYEEELKNGFYWSTGVRLSIK